MDYVVKRVIKSESAIKVFNLESQKPRTEKGEFN